MKDKILKIINNNISISQSGYMNGQADIEGVEDTVSELTALMCYREVRAIIEWLGIEHLVEEYEYVIVMQLKETYDTGLIWTAIEQVKNELK